MFKKLKRKMLVLNLSILTVLLVIVFSSLYLTNYNQVQNGINFELERIINNYDLHTINDAPPPIDGGIIGERTVSFVIITDLDGNIINTVSSFTSDEDFFNEAYELISENKRVIDLDGNSWQYLAVTRNQVMIYAFVDYTAEQQLLTNMIYSFIVIFIGAFIVVFLISNYFSTRSIKQIKEAFVKQKQFIANASHELKTPLAIIGTNTDVLLEKDSNNKWLSYIKYETERMNKLTKDLLYLTKMSEQEPKEIIRSRVNLSELVESSILSFEALAYQKEIDINYEISPEIYVDIDPNQFNQVFHILVDNAVKYTPKKGNIFVALEFNHNQIIYTITNSGEGIKNEDIENVFDRFYMGDKSRSLNPNSYGLGLSIAKTIIENHQAKITCESIPNESTKFVIKLKNRYVK